MPSLFFVFVLFFFSLQVHYLLLCLLCVSTSTFIGFMESFWCFIVIEAAERQLFVNTCCVVRAQSGFKREKKKRLVSSSFIYMLYSVPILSFSFNLLPILPPCLYFPPHSLLACVALTMTLCLSSGTSHTVIEATNSFPVQRGRNLHSTVFPCLVHSALSVEKTLQEKNPASARPV